MDRELEQMESRLNFKVSGYFTKQTEPNFGPPKILIISNFLQKVFFTWEQVTNFALRIVSKIIE